MTKEFDDEMIGEFERMPSAGDAFRKSSEFKVIGIDPGLTGGIVSVRRDNHDGGIVTAYKFIPTAGKDIDVNELQDFLILSAPTIVYVEVQQIRSRQRGALTIGANYGRILATIELCGIDCEIVTPQAWQKYIFQGKVENTKEAASLFCDEMRFSIPMTSTRKNARPHDGVADAFCIAMYGFDNYVYPADVVV